MKKTNKPTFPEFLRRIYGLTLEQYDRLNDHQKTAAELDYKSRYGAIKWF